MSGVVVLMPEDTCILSTPDSLLNCPILASKCYITVCQLSRSRNICGVYNPFLERKVPSVWCEVEPITIKHMLNRHHGDAVCRLFCLILHRLTVFVYSTQNLLVAKIAALDLLNHKTTLNGYVSQSPHWNASCWMLRFCLYV